MILINKIVNYFKKNRVASHILFWVVLFITSVCKDLIIYNKIPNFITKHAFILNSVGFLTHVIASYFIVYLIIPKYIKTKKYISALVFFCLGVYISAVIRRILIVYIAEPLLAPLPYDQEPISEILSDLGKLLQVYIPRILLDCFLFISVKFFFNEEREKEKKLKLAKEKAELELNTLKGQLNPHFLFNTLNNIYSLSIDNSPKTSESIAKLSEMLDQVLYKSDSKFVPIESELALIENFIELEKLRYDEQLKVSLTSDIEHKIQIPPLILLSLVENAFKHGAGEDDGSPTIDVSMKSTEKAFLFSVKNSISEHYKTDNKKAIGLANIRKQLDLIYGNSYDLQIDIQLTEFIVTLTINS